MRCQIIILLAVYSNIIEAGPVRNVHQRSQYVQVGLNYEDSALISFPSRKHWLRRFANTTDTSIFSTTEIAPSTTSIVPIPISSDASLDSKVPSRVATSADSGQEQGERANAKQNGINVMPEGIPSEGAVIAASTSERYPAKSVSNEPATATISKQTTGSASVSDQITMTSATTSTTRATQAAQPQDNINEASPTPRLPNPSKNKLEGNLQNGEVASKQTQSGISTSPSSVASTPPSSEQSAVDGGVAMDAFQRARASQSVASPSMSATQTQAVQTSAAPQSKADLPTTTQLPLSSPVNAQTSYIVGGFADTSSSLSGQSSAFLKTATFSMAPSPTSVFGQVPASLIGSNADYNSAVSTSNVLQTTGTAATSSSPSTTDGTAQIAQGYNEKFQKLNGLSQCDPTNNEQSSACVNGQPAKCEADGIYTFISCDKGEQCYAVPKANGKPGMDIGCYTPSAAQHAIAGAGPAGNGAQSGQAATPSSDKVAPGQVVAGSMAQASATPSTTASASSQPSTKAVALADTVPSDSPANNPSGQKTGNTNSIFPEPKAGVGSINKPSSTSTSQTAPTPTIGDLPKGGQDGSASSPPTNQGASSKQGSQPKTGQDGNADHKKQDQGSSSKSVSNDDDSVSGIQLHFPGSKGSGDNSKDKQSDAKQDSGRTPPAAGQKNAIAAAGNPSSTPLPISTSTTAPAGITPAPAQNGDPVKGFITVTVTETTTVHDRLY